MKKNANTTISTTSCIKDLNINPVTLNLIEEKAGNNLNALALQKLPKENMRNFLNITPVSQILILAINKMDLLKLKSF